MFRIFQTLLWPKVSLGNEECASNFRCNIDMGAYATHCLKNAIKGLHIASDGLQHPESMAAEPRKYIEYRRRYWTSENTCCCVLEGK